MHMPNVVNRLKRLPIVKFCERAELSRYFGCIYIYTFTTISNKEDKEREVERVRKGLAMTKGLRPSIKKTTKGRSR